MRSVADNLRARHARQLRRRSPQERLAVALELGQRDLMAFQKAQRLDRATARRELQRRRQLGRKPSRCSEEILG